MTHTSIKSLFAATAFAAIGAFGVAAPPAHAQMAMPAMDSKFVKTVSRANVAEMMTAKLALQKSKDEKVRTIATTIIKDHGTAEASLKSLAGTYKMMLPMEADARHKKAYAKLQGMSGTEFDSAYLKGQVKDHYAAVNLFQDEMAKGEDSKVRGYAAKFLPTIEQHTKLITAAASNRGIKTATKTGMTPAKMKRMDKMDNGKMGKMNKMDKK